MDVHRWGLTEILVGTFSISISLYLGISDGPTVLTRLLKAVFFVRKMAPLLEKPQKYGSIFVEEKTVP